MNTPPISNRGLLRTLSYAILLAFSLFLAYRFLTTIATIALTIMVGVLLAVALSGPVEALHRRKVPRVVATALIFLVAGALLGLGGYLLLPVLAEQVYQFVTSLPAALSRLAGWVEGLESRFGVSVPAENLSLSALTDPARQLLGGALGVFGNVASILASAVIILFLSFYLAANPEPVVGWVTRLFPPDRRPRARAVLSAVRSGLLYWVKGQLTAMIIIGILWSVALFLIGIPGALFLGILAGLLNFVPYLGPVVAAVPPLLLALTVSPAMVLWVFLSYLAIQAVEGYVVTPLVMERTTLLHPAVVIATIAVLSTAFGLLGTLLAVPATVAAGVLVEELWFRRLEAKDS
ncbi:MAG: AI-2E family transporter [Actinomycetota bacterium]|nr:AI-2E family transporter [Actinomycetota bacterium]